ncbi:MAG: STAS-like domain-containing protein [Anaerostipes caccae]
MRIRIKNFINGETAISYEAGKECLKEILKELDQGNDIILDFLDVEYVITAFLNPIIGDLILLKGQDIMKMIKIENANKNTIDKIKLVKDGALLKREDLE